MQHCLEVAGLVLNTIGASALALFTFGGVTINADGSMTMGGDPNLSTEENKRRNRRKYRIQRYGVPCGWLLFAAGFVLQLAALFKSS